MWHGTPRMELELRSQFTSHKALGCGSMVSRLASRCFSIWSLDEEIRWFKCIAIHRQGQEKVVALQDDLSIIIKRIVRCVVVWVVNQI